MSTSCRLVVSCVDYPLACGPQRIVVRAFDADTHCEVAGEVLINGQRRADMVTNQSFSWILAASDMAIVRVDGYAPVACALTVAA